MSGMLFAMRFFAGPYVLRKEQTTEAARMNRNSFVGKVSGVGIPTNIDLCRVIPQPTQVPIITPLKELERTKMKAS